ncbi:Hypothetical protein NCS54_01196600 [Fusarium falciforme]|uniref:Hypothetical protein n=1 Tax=Fusarium falciforme TaxID=195108 RepID=UPI00230060E6|nr:Hypothetical protein NCS54_01196600 [Fusarium falciforme]WAO94385.1 Hypothetical protein NCS54_01196600 [Fusarium falciforme]
MEDSTALIAGPHVEHTQPKDRYLYPQNDALPPSGDVDVDIDEAWRRFEVARRSAEFYMDRYFQHLKAGSARPETAPNSHFDAVETRGEQLRNGRYWGMKAARDCLIRDLNEMSLWIEQLALSRQPEVRIPIGVAFFSGMAISGLQQVRSELLQAVVCVGTGAALLTLVSSLGYMLHGIGRREAYSHYKESISQCLDAAYGWTLTDGHQSVVRKHQYQLLRGLS